MSGSAKLVAIGITYPYQVIRSRIQVRPDPLSFLGPLTDALQRLTQYRPVSATASSPPYTSIPDVITRTYRSEGLSGFYKGIATNAVRILPGTCVTFVVYEQLSRWLGRMAERREARERGTSAEVQVS